MKGYPKGWKPPKKKFQKAPTPPPNQVHDSLKKKAEERRDWKAEEIDDGREKLTECRGCDKLVPEFTIGGVCGECDQKAVKEFEESKDGLKRAAERTHK